LIAPFRQRRSHRPTLNRLGSGMAPSGFMEIDGTPHRQQTSQ
jgi:hypothetical protein